MTLPCPKCGNPIPALPGTKTVCVKCGAEVHVCKA
jgi:NMD protein affecting ribosome stability and mRNA decay